MRLLHLPTDPRAIAVTATYDLRQEDELRAAVEAIETHGLAPSGWADHIDLRALPFALRNPLAIASAERILTDELSAAVTRAFACKSSFEEDLRKGYGGVISYSAARSCVFYNHDGFEAARRVPGGALPYADGWTWGDVGPRRLPKNFKREEGLVSWPAAFAYAAHVGADWQRAVYALGLAPAHLHRYDVSLGAYRDRWHIIVNDGDGWELPELEIDPNYKQDQR